MSFRGVVFVVLMLFWLFGVGYIVYDAAVFSPKTLGMGLIPWLCVALVGYEVFGKKG